MSKSVSILSKSIIVVLLIVLGMMIQYRFAVLGQKTLADLTWLKALESDKGSSVDTQISVNQVDLEQFWQVWSLLQKDYYDPEKLDKEKMVEGATKGLAASIGDAYTMYLSPKENERSGEDLAGTFSGVGIELGYKDGVLAAIAPLPDSPAAKAGVQAGDLILRVKDSNRDFDETTDGWSLDRAIDEIRGPKGTPVTLTLYREDNGNKPFEVEILRDDVVVKSAELEFVPVDGGEVAHISLMRFGGHTDEEWENLIGQIQSREPPVKGIVLDMRNNPGGFFDGAIRVASEFVDNGVIVKQQGKYSTESYEASGPARLKDLPVVVLVNKGSASASEIVAGALRDRLGVKLVGEQTFGKGTVQDRRELPDGGGLHVTIARWLLPLGSSIQDEGIPVDIEAEDDVETEDVDEALNTAIEVLIQ